MKATLVFLTGLFFIIGVHPRLSAQEATKLMKLTERSTAELLEDEGEKVRVLGFVDETRKNATGIHFLEFKDSDFVCVTFARYAKEFEGPPSEIYKEKWLEVTGEIENYRGNPQIKLLTPDQVKIVPGPPPPKPVVEVAKTDGKGEPGEEEEKPKEEEVKPVVAKKEPEGPVVEIIDGVQALDWRKYFPEKPKP